LDDFASKKLFGVYLYTRQPNVSVYKYTMRSQDIIKALKSGGWEQVAQKGSHVQFKHPTSRVTVPHSKSDIPIGTFRSIEKQAALKLK
jgi:predicted RNA binding protein YcfA (HicA-like mRNA interferase family)